MSHSLNCPNCGAPLEYDGNDPIIRCPYCNSSVIVPENLRARPSFSSKPSNLTFGGAGDLGELINQARRINEVKNLAESGQMDEAVALYRQITGSDEFSARQAVGRLSSGQPVTLTGMSADEVMSQVRMSSGPGIQVQTLDSRTTRQIGGWLGCFIAFVVIFILASVLIPVGLAMVGAFAASDIDKIINDISGVESPLDDGFASQEWSFGGEGTGPGKFADVRAIGAARDGGAVFAANFDDGRVQVFDGQGNFQTQWVIPKEISDPYFDTMAVGRDGVVYIPVFGKILKFDSQGNSLGAIEHKGYRFEDLDIALDGSIVAIANGEDIVWLTAGGEIQQVVEDAVSSVSGDSELSCKLAVDGTGRVYVLARFNDGVFIFGADGRFINRFGSAGDEQGQFRAPYEIAVDSQGRIYVSSTQGVQVFSNDGRYLDVIKVQYFAYGLAFDDQDNLYVTTNQKMVEKFRIKE